MWLINTHNGIKEKSIKPINIDNYPAIKKHLDLYYPELTKRYDKGDTPYNLRNCVYTEDFSKQKLIWIELADKGRFAFDNEDNFITLNGTYILTGNDLEYLCAILNNPITSWHFNTFCISSGVGTNQWRELYVNKLLIPDIPKERQQSFIKVFYEIFTLEKQKKSSIKIQFKLNQMIYELLELNNEEIKFIESH